MQGAEPAQNRSHSRSRSRSRSRDRTNHSCARITCLRHPGDEPEEVGEVLEAVGLLVMLTDADSWWPGNVTLPAATLHAPPLCAIETISASTGTEVASAAKPDFELGADRSNTNL